MNDFGAVSVRVCQSGCLFPLFMIVYILLLLLQGFCFAVMHCFALLLCSVRIEAEISVLGKAVLRLGYRGWACQEMCSSLNAWSVFVGQ